MKAVLISIRPQWCQKIIGGEKTIEVRKSRPAMSTPFKCYIYCTYGHGLIMRRDAILPNVLLDQMVMKGRIWGNCCNGKVIGEFTCNGVYAVLAHPTIFAGHPLFFEKAVQDSCLSADEIESYSDGKDLCGWHISGLVIYDDPKELSEFIKPCGNRLTRPPQSWCYVEELK